jgi:hypothetical protein
MITMHDVAQVADLRSTNQVPPSAPPRTAGRSASEVIAS